jgi:hypothetical protein
VGEALRPLQAVAQLLVVEQQDLGGDAGHHLHARHRADGLDLRALVGGGERDHQLAGVAPQRKRLELLGERRGDAHQRDGGGGLEVLAGGGREASLLGERLRDLVYADQAHLDQDGPQTGLALDLLLEGFLELGRGQPPLG